MDIGEGIDQGYNFKYVEETELNRIIESVQETRRKNHTTEEGDASTAETKFGYRYHPYEVSNVDEFLRGAGKPINDLLYPDSKEAFQNNAWSSSYTYIKDVPKNVLSSSSSGSLLSSHSGFDYPCTVESLWTADLDDANASSEEKLMVVEEEKDEEVDTEHNENSIVSAKSCNKVEEIRRFSKEILEDPVIEENFQKLLNVTYSNMAELGYDPDSFMEKHKHTKIPESSKSEEDLLIGDNYKTPSYLSFAAKVRANASNIDSLPVAKEDEGTKNTDNCVTVSKSPPSAVKSSIDSSKQEKVLTNRKIDISTLKETNQEKTLHENLPLISSEVPPCTCLPKVPLECKIKLRAVHSKTITLLECVYSQLECAILEADGAVDADRRRRRDIEFTSRFSRNYLYELTRQMSELPRLLAVKNKTLALTQQLCQRLLALHQIIVQGLQAYLKHLPETLEPEMPGRVVGLLTRTMELTDICLTYDLSPAAADLKKKITRLLNQRVKEKEKAVPKRRPASARQRTTLKAAKETKDRWVMYKSRQRKKMPRENIKPGLSKTPSAEAADSRETCDMVRDPDVSTAISEIKERAMGDLPGSRRAVVVRSAPNLPLDADNDGKPQDSEKLLSAIRYKKRLQRMMKKNPLVLRKENRAWEMISKVVTQLINESIVDISANFTSERPDDDSEF